VGFAQGHGPPQHQYPERDVGSEHTNELYLRTLWISTCPVSRRTY